MQSRRDLLKRLGFAAACAATVGGLTFSSSEAPWWLIKPLSKGSSLGKGWRIQELSSVVRGAAVLTLGHRDGRQARVHLCARHGQHEGIVSSQHFDLVLMDGRNGTQPTDEGLGRALMGLARRIRRNEKRPEGRLTRLLTHAERVSIYGPQQLV